MSRRNIFFTLSLFLILFMTGIFYENSNTVMKELDQVVLASTSEGAQVGSKAKNFTLLNTKGEKVSLHDYRGKYVLVNFFATWCGPCVEEMPTLVEIDRRYSSDQLTIIGVNLTKQERDPNDVRPFLDHFKAEYEVVFDIEGNVMEDYQLIGIPTSILINDKGVIIKRINGMVSIEQIINEVKPKQNK